MTRNYFEIADIKINANRILRNRLAQSLGLDRYSRIMKGNPDSEEFKKEFNRFYQVRRNKDWKKKFYRLFAVAKENQYTCERTLFN